MNPRITIVLLVVLAGLGLVVFGLQPGAAGSGGPTPTPQPTITSGNPDDVNRLSVEFEGKTTLVTLGSDGKWKLQPNDQEADDARIRGLVSRLVNLRATTRVNEPATNLSTFGLDKPSLKATLGKKDGSQVVLLVGSETPVATGYYVKTQDGDAVFVVPALTVSDLKRMVENPPYPPPTPTPRPTIEATPVPTSTPTPIGTPTTSG